MTGSELLIVGGLLMCNLGTLAWMIKSNSTTTKQKTDENTSDDINQTGAKEIVNGVDSIPSEETPAVDKALEDLSNKFMEVIPRLITSALGDVNINDVIFGKTEEDEDSSLQNDEAKELNSDQIIEAFETDLRNDDPLPPSAPETDGHTFEELEKSIDIALDDTASEEEKAQAGKVLQDYESTQMFDVLKSNDDIGRHVDLCLRLAIKMEIAEKNSAGVKVNKAKPSKIKSVSDSSNVKSKRKEVKINWENIDIDNFDPADLLKK